MSSAKGSDPPAFQSRDPRSAAFWDERFAQGFMPWDEGGSPSELLDWLSARAPTGAGQRVFIPGAGLAHEVRAFHANGIEPLALDISIQAVQQARGHLATLGIYVQHGDAFAYQPIAPFDLVYERAFLCALPAAMHSAWADMVRRLVKPGGHLIGYFYLSGAPSEKGPPFALTPQTVQALLTPHFTCVDDRACASQLEAFGAGQMHWQVWRAQPLG
jgi:SAM-dependent methyltransferase